MANTQQGFVEHIVDQSEDFDRWYVQVVQQAELAEDAPVRGCRIIRPYGFALWENMQASLDKRFKDTGVQNAYFPLFIPQSMLEREADHVEGFAPEVAWVTRGGGKELEEPLAVRPTSEAIICSTFARWVQSHRDLPILINQWASVVRWEDRPRAFLRTTEFLWQEGHTCHASQEEAEQRARLMLDVYQDFIETELAIPAIAGVKSESERFAGARHTYTLEAMMGGKRWALQSATSHDLGDNFGKAFGIEFLDADGERKYGFNTSWGLSFRTIGAMIMVHGDDAGLKMPPRVAPIQVVIVPIWRKGTDREAVEQAVEQTQQALSEVARVHVDWREDKSTGWKFNEWELKGVPIRLEIGPRDVENQQVTLVRRDTREKQAVPTTEVVDLVPQLLDEIQTQLYDDARRMLDEHTKEISSYDELKERAAANAGFSLAWWCGDESCEDRVKAETHATIRCIPFDQPEEVGPCIVCDAPGRDQVIFARAY